MRALFNMATPPYLMEILNNDFQDRKVIFITNKEEQEYVVTAGVSQGSVLCTTTMEHYVRWST